MELSGDYEFQAELSFQEELSSLLSASMLSGGTFESEKVQTVVKTWVCAVHCKSVLFCSSKGKPLETQGAIKVHISKV